MGDQGNWWDTEADDYYADTSRGGGVASAKVTPQRGKSTPKTPSTPSLVHGDSALSAAATDMSMDNMSVSALDDGKLVDMLYESDGDQEDDSHGVDRWLGPELGEQKAKPDIKRRASVRIRPPQASSYDTIDHALERSKVFQSQLDELLQVADDLPKSVQQRLLSIQDSIGFVTATLEEELNSRDERSDVEALLDLDNVNWDFQNAEVDNFRARAARVAHGHFAFKEWHAPQFYSSYPVPDMKRLICSVSFPTDSNLRQIKVAMKVEDTVASFLQGAINEFHKKQAKMHGDVQLGPMDGYVLKAKGFKEYMDPREDPSKRMFDHENIRQCIRNRLPVELAVVTRMEHWTPAVDEDEHAAAYAVKVDEDVKVLSLHEHQDLASRFSNMKWMERAQLPFVPMSAIPQFFRVQIMGIDNVDQHRLPRLSPAHNVLFVQSFLFHGTEILSNGIGQTPFAAITNSPRWRHWIANGKTGIPIPYNQIPRESRIAFLLYGQQKREAGQKQEEGPVLLAYVVHQLIDVQGFLASGSMTLSMWPVEKPKKEQDRKIQAKREQGYFFIFRATTRENKATKLHATKVQVRFPTFVQPVVAPIVERVAEEKKSLITMTTGGSTSKFSKLFDSNDISKKIEKIKNATKDLFYKMDANDKALLNSKGPELVNDPSWLPKYLLSVDWTQVQRRQECYRLLPKWATYNTHTEQLGQALELLGANYADYRVREYAVGLLRSVPDDELQLYLLQLAQCLKIEPYHDSPLARFLLSRALANPYQIGHHFFWTLKAELNWMSPDFCERYGVILEEYLSHCGHFVKELRKQNNTVLRLQKVAEHIANLKNNLKQSKPQCMKVYVEQLKKLNVTFFNKMGSFAPPLNPKLEATDLIVDKCRFMSSKKVPLLLLYNNADEEASPLSVIFKSGDDLRQDILTLQLLRVMDKIWLADGLDLAMKPYTCIATGINDDGEGVGMIETVTESETVADIQWMYGGEQASAAFNDTVIEQFLRDNNKGAEYTAAVDRFMRSCAGYCVATYLLGIGDRHNDNYMVRKDGVFFHIDFGHFLGNWKYKMGICRERTKFVFTPEMCYVMGGKSSKLFSEFKEICFQALLAARKYGRLLENLFALMASAGMPELVIQEDVYYLRDRLMLGEKDSAAKKAFLKELKASLNDRVRRIDNQFHLMKHKGT